MACGSHRPHVALRRLRTILSTPRDPAATVLILVLGAWLATGIAAFPAEAATHGVETGLYDHRLQPAGLDSSLTAEYVREAAAGLHTGWIRLNCPWSRLEPVQGEYDEAEFARVDGLVAAFHASGVKVILTVYSTPHWASDPAFWDSPPPGVSRGYQPYYPMRTTALADFAALGELLARRYSGEVQALECWNEPNMWRYLYPQRTGERPSFGAQTYLRMLRAFATGVRRSGADVRVVAGSTTSYGTDDQLQTSPRRFARSLRHHGAARWFDVYSCHPYAPGGSAHLAPDEPPDDPARTVTLGNLGALLRIFPDKPFYITEYGYNTRPSVDYGWLWVSERLQASYLARAYAAAARHPQVKTIIWFLIVDAQPGADEPPDSGVYTGLRRPDGTRKPSWYVFAALRGAGD
jgi:hypothetical protein